jgi:hypothetical protein
MLHLGGSRKLTDCFDDLDELFVVDSNTGVQLLPRRDCELITNCDEIEVSSSGVS